MNTNDVRAITSARNILVDHFQVGLHQLAPGTSSHACTPEQLAAIDKVTWDLWNLVVDDPYPARCVECDVPLPPAPATGRPRRYCSDRCRQAAWRDRAASTTDA